jgi:zinc transport system ATP-binding protein
MKEKIKHQLKGRACGLCCTKIQDFGVTLGNTEILKGINLHVHCGELTAIIGPNGAGKSTFLKAILGELPFTGKLSFLDSKGDHSGRPAIGYVPQRVEIDPTAPLSVLDLFSASLSLRPVWLGSSQAMVRRVKKSLERVKAGKLINQRVGNLSGGELQRVLLALALDPVPDLLLLDEPVSGVDHSGMELFYGILSDIRRDYDLTIMLVSHDLDLVSKHATRAVLLNRELICAGTPAEVFSSPLFLDTFGLKWTRDLAVKKE